MDMLNRIAKWTPIGKALAVIWLGGALACVALAIAALLLNESMHESARQRAWQDTVALADVAHDEILSMPSEGKKLRAAVESNFSRVRRNLSRLTSMSFALAGRDGILAEQTLAIAEIGVLGDNVLPALRGKDWARQFEARTPTTKYFVAFRPIQIAGEPVESIGVVVWGDHEKLLSGFHAQRRQLVASTIGIATMLILMTFLVAAYVRNKLSLSAALQQREARLASSEALLLEAQRLAKIGSWEVGTSFDSFVATRGYYDIYQVSEQTVPRTDEEYISRFLVEPEDIRRARSQVTLLATGSPMHGLRYVRLNDGTRKWIEFHVVPSLDAKGRRVGARGIVRDVTHEREALAALETRTTQLEQAKEIAGMGTWTMEIPGDRLVTCAQMRRIYGTDIENTPVSMREWGRRFIPPEEQAEFWPQLDAHFYGRAFDRERRIITADGDEKWIRTIAKPEFNEQGNLIRFSGITLDITSHKRAMLALAERTAQLEKAQQLGRMGSWYWNVVTDHVNLSAQHRAIYGLNDDAVIATMQEWVDKFGHPDEKSLALESLNEVKRGCPINEDRRVRNAAGRDMWIHVIAEPIADRNGEVVGVAGISRDITEEKLRQLELIETSRRLQEAQRIARLGHFYWDLKTDHIEPFGDFDIVFGLMPLERFRTMREWEEAYCHPDDRPTPGNWKVGVMKAYQVQRRTRVQDGSYRWVEISGEATYSHQGDIVGYRGVARDIHESKITQLQLAENEARYRLISENMHEHVALHRPDGTIIYSSPSTRTLLGYSAERSVGAHPFVNVHPGDLPIVQRTLAEVFPESARQSVTLEYRFRHRSGRYVWLETIIVPVRDQTGALLHFQSSSRDITSRREAEDQLRDSEERFRTLTEVSSDWYWETDAEHRFTFISIDRNPLHETQPRQIIGRTRWDAFPDGLTEEGWRLHQETLNRRIPFTGTVVKMYYKDGSPAFSSVSGRPRFDERGEFLGYRGTGRDITRIKLAEQRLAESEQRFRLIAQSMQDVVSLHELNGAVSFLSPSFHAVTGHALDDVRVSVRHLIHPQDRREVLRAFSHIARSPAESTTITARLKHASGGYLWFESSMTHVAGADAPRVQIVSRDVTRKREAERQLARRTAELARINRQLAVEVQQRQGLERNMLMTIEMELARVGLELHDQLGQDLTGISLMVKTLERRLLETNPDMAANALRISELVNNTIRHTRMISHGLSPYIWGSNGLAAALSQLAADIQALGVVEIRSTIEAEVGIRDELVARNFYRIAQEASNNALKHSRADHLAIELSRRGDMVVLKVSDDGIGSHSEEPGAVTAENRFHSIRHRCSVIGAELSIRHPRRGGTVVKIQWQNSSFDKTSSRDAQESADREMT